MMRFRLLVFLLLSTAAAAMEPMDDAALAETRAGYFYANGMSIEFGAQISSTVDGQVVLETNMNLTERGLESTQSAAPGSLGLENSADYGINLPAMQQTGVLVPGDGGATALIQNTTGGLSNVVINTASNRLIVQNLQITVAIADLPALEQQMAVARLASSLNGALGLELH